MFYITYSKIIKMLLMNRNSPDKKISKMKVKINSKNNCNYSFNKLINRNDYHQTN